MTSVGDNQEGSGMKETIAFGGTYLARKVKSLFGAGPQYTWLLTDACRPDQLDKLREAVVEGKLKTNLDKVFELEQVGDMYENSVQGRTRGKCVLRVADWAAEQ